MTKQHAPTEISSSGAKVVASGSVVPFHEPGEVAFEMGPADGRLAVIVRFEDAPRGGPAPGVEVKRAGARVVRIVVRSPTSGEVAGTTSPVTLGTLAGLKLWAHFRVFGAGPRTLHYTFFLEGGDISLAETLLRPE